MYRCFLATLALVVLIGPACGERLILEMSTDNKLSGKLARMDALMKSLAKTDHAEARANAHRVKVARERAWLNVAIKEAAEKNGQELSGVGREDVEMRKALGLSEVAVGRKMSDAECPDSPGCEAIPAEHVADTCKIVEPQPVALGCPKTCNVSYENSHCALTASPCLGVDAHGCMDGHRAAPECKLPFTYRNKVYPTCTTAGDWRKREWCSHDAEYKSRQSGHSFCDECSEQVFGTNPELWEDVGKQLRCSAVSFIAGTGTEMKYVFENKGQKAASVFPAMSGGKWLGATAFAGAVADGILEWDTKIADVFSWWTKNNSDPRSRITFRHVMTFTDGFVDTSGTFAFTHDVFTQRCLTPGFNLFYTPEECAKQIYDTANHTGEPGTIFEYNSFHHQLAMAMVTKLSGLDAQAYFRKYLFEKAGMQNSYYLGEGNPFVAGGLMTTSFDYAKFLQAYIRGEMLPPAVLAVFETEYKNSHHALDIATISFPNYAMSNFKQGPCVTMGGSVANCVNHDDGTFYLMVPPLSEYLSMGEALQGGPGGANNVLIYGISWVQDALTKALAVSK